MTDTATADEPVALEDLFAETLTALRDGDDEHATALIEKITTACGTTADAERPRFEAAAAGDADAEEELLDDLQMMGALMQVAPAKPQRVFNFAIPERQAEADPLAHIQPNPAALGGLFH